MSIGIHQFYVTFGTDHVHTIPRLDGSLPPLITGPNVVMVVYAVDVDHARETVFDRIGPAWSFMYREDRPPDMSHFPGGEIFLNEPWDVKVEEVEAEDVAAVDAPFQSPAAPPSYRLGGWCRAVNRIAGRFVAHPFDIVASTVFACGTDPQHGARVLGGHQPMMYAQSQSLAPDDYFDPGPAFNDAVPIIPPQTNGEPQ